MGKLDAMIRNCLTCWLAGKRAQESKKHPKEG